ncbi:ChbG/HpnK family deacetylase [Noviherbaspirillum galbum]|uniref:ChbG/HpnK family deacetylase n=1 Tax=Noviherbaspirillum galbum TaxID=2709383 RepID=A0A6B3SPA0_9BURK|nr:ChbG/HpnK family deacetylase [Noviherbaspirillum galbum]NEX62720.1 ChbG/HpnK family deacetylase [Noviherbaspirillum galbum]
MLIINADDFGYSESVNQAIAESFAAGLISSTTIMANAPAFEHACDLARRMGFADKIGIHLNLTEGRPLTTGIRQSRIFCDEKGNLGFKRFTHYWLPRDEINLVREEVAQQIHRCRKHGISLTHADSHHHVHTELFISLAVVRELRRLSVPYLRLSDNVRAASIARRTYKANLNWIISLNGLKGTDYFCDLNDIASLPRECMSQDTVVELMVHPAYAADGSLIDAEMKQPFRPLLSRVTRPDKLVSYGDLHHCVA